MGEQIRSQIEIESEASIFLSPRQETHSSKTLKRYANFYALRAQNVHSVRISIYFSCHKEREI